MDQIKSFYLNKLLSKIKTTIYKHSGSFEHIILIDFDRMPSNINTLADTLQEDLFRIIAAPVPEIPCTSYKRDAKEYINNYSWGTHNIKYIIKTTGGCLSFIDKALLEYIFSEHKSQNEFPDLDDSAYFDIYNSLARDVYTNNELALLIVLLKKLNDDHDFIQKQYTDKEIFLIKQEYYENAIYISELQEECYGTVSEQVTVFEKMMLYYMKPEITKTKFHALNEILVDKQNKKRDNFQNFETVNKVCKLTFYGNYRCGTAGSSRS